MNKNDKENKNEEQKEQPVKSKKKSPSIGNLFGLGIVGQLIAALVGIWLISVSWYSFIFFALGMLPAIVTYVLDRSSGRFATKTVAACNFIGIMPYLFDIVLSYERSILSKQLMADLEVWLFVYGAASIGWIMIWMMPQLTLIIFVTKTEMKIRKLKKEQEELVKIWGEDIKKAKVKL